MDNKEMKYNKLRVQLNGIANKSFSGIRKFVAFFNFLFNLIGNHPRFFTGISTNIIQITIRFY